MAQSKLEILLTLKDQASSGLKSIGTSLQGLGSKELGALKTGLLGVAAGLTAVGVGAAKLAIDAAPLANVKAAFDGIAQAAGIGGDKMLAALQKSSAGMVDNESLMKSFNRAAQLVSVDFATKLPEAMQYLSKVSAATGQDMNYMLESLVVGVGRVSPMILDNLGVQVSLTEATEKYAATIGKEASELTKSEQQAAVLNMTLEKLAKNTAAMPDVTESANAKFASFGTTLKNFKDDVGMALLPAANQLMEVIGPALSNAIATVMPYIQQFTTYLSQLIAAIIDAGLQSTETKEVLSAMFGPEVANTIMNVIAWLTQLKDTIAAFVTEQLIPFVYQHAEAFKAVLIAIGAILAAAAIASAIAGIAGAIAALLNPIGLIIAIVGVLAVAWTQNWGGIQEKTQAALEFIRGIINSVLGWIQTFWAAHGEQIKATAQAIWDGVVAVFNWFKDYFKKVFEAFSLLFKGDFEGFGAKLREIWDMVWKAIGEIATKAWAWIKENFAKLVTSIKDFIIKTDWLQVGENILIGIANGITAGAKWVINAILKVAKSIWGTLIGFFDSKSPSVKMAGLGQDLMQGWAIGIKGASQLPTYAMAKASQSVSNSTVNSITVLGGITVPPAPSTDDFIQQLSEFMI